MRVLFVCSGNSKSFEVVPFIKEQGESLREQGIEVDYFPVRGKGVKGYVKSGLELRKYLKNNQYDLIHAHYTLSGWAAIIGAGSTPVVLSLMGSDAYGEYVGVGKVQLSSRISTLLTWLIQPLVQAIISKSANIEQYVYQKHKSFIVPNGINRNKFNATTKVTKEEMGLDPARKYVLFLGSKENVRKNFALAKKAFDTLNAENVELLSPYPVPHQEIPRYMNVADVLVVPSLMEGSPNVIKEAMACNCPMVATDIGDVKWVLGNTPGCYLASFEPDDFADKLGRALAFAEEQGKTKGTERILELGLDAAATANRIIEIYAFALKRTPQVVAG